MASDQHFSLKCFPENNFVSKLLQNFQACLGHPECEWVNKKMQNVCIQSHRSYIEVKTTYNKYIFLKLTVFRNVLQPVCSV